MAYSEKIKLEICLLRGNEEFTLAQITRATWDTLDTTAVGVPTLFCFVNDEIRVWPAPAEDEYYHLRHVRTEEQNIVAFDDREAYGRRA